MSKELDEKEDNKRKNAHNQEPEAQNTEGAEPSDEAEQLQLKLEEALKSAESFKDQLLRKAAEFENYKRRIENEYANLIKGANEGLIQALLPILNDFHRSLKLGKAQKDYDAFYKGVELIYNKFTRVLEAQGLVPFDSVGKPFDVDYHDALLQVPRDDVPHHTVIEEVERGYLFNDKVLRHAKVIVSSLPSGQEEEGKLPEKGDSKANNG
jgi:molecular chaperone GrpE